MKRILIRRVVFLLLVGLGWAVWYGYARWNASRAEHCETLTLYGNVEIHQVDLAFRVAGRIEDMKEIRFGPAIRWLDWTPVLIKMKYAGPRPTLPCRKPLWPNWRPDTDRRK